MLIDLTHRLSESVRPYPGDPVFERSRVDIDNFNVHQLRLSSHWGTHIDAPAHINDTAHKNDTGPQNNTVPSLSGVESIPLETLFGPARCLPLNAPHIVPQSESGFPSPLPDGYVITPGDLIPFDSWITSGARLLLRTGWSRYWNSDRYYNPAQHPRFSRSALRWLADRRIRLLGLDLCSPELCLADEAVTDAHRILLGANVILLENLTNLDQLPPPGQAFHLSALPLPIVDLDGCPVRAIAEYRKPWSQWG